MLKSTGSEFHGFPRDRFTTLAETDDRILATAVTARWRYADPELDFNAAYAAIRRQLLETFATTHSLALQQTLYAMGAAVLEARPEVAEIRFSMPEQAPLPRRSRARSGSTTRTRSSSPPTAPTG